jgi:hypothetical protein
MPEIRATQRKANAGKKGSASIAIDIPKPPKEPAFVELLSQKMAVVTTVGDPNEVLGNVYPALYGSVFTLKFALKKSNPKGETFKVLASRGRYPDAHRVPKNRWTIRMGLPVPEDTLTLPQKVPGVEVKLETWDYGACAVILHTGPYSTEGPTIERLHNFIFDNGRVLNGEHEEWYLTRPNAKVQKTIVLYPVRAAANTAEIAGEREAAKAYYQRMTGYQLHPQG